MEEQESEKEQLLLFHNRYDLGKNLWDMMHRSADTHHDTCQGLWMRVDDVTTIEINQFEKVIGKENQ